MNCSATTVNSVWLTMIVMLQPEAAGLDWDHNHESWGWVWCVCWRQSGQDTLIGAIRLVRKQSQGYSWMGWVFFRRWCRNVQDLEIKMWSGCNGNWLSNELSGAHILPQTSRQDVSENRPQKCQPLCRRKEQILGGHVGPDAFLLWPPACESWYSFQEQLV